MKNLLNLDKIMNKKQINMERMAVLVVLAYTIGLLIGEQIRDQVHGGTKKNGSSILVYSCCSSGRSV